MTLAQIVTLLVEPYEAWRIRRELGPLPSYTAVWVADEIERLRRRNYDLRLWDRHP